jgi:glycosyltransferase involved in cell wall biosynthesis
LPGTRRIVLCDAQVPFSRGGGEALTEGLARRLEGRGFAVELVRLPFSWTPREQLLKSALAWRMLDLRTAGGEAVDLVIATRFPSYLIRHPRKVVWLVHQFRQIYELKGTRYSDFGEGAEDRGTAEMIRGMDRRALGEAAALYTISQNTAERLRRFNGLEAAVLYPPSNLEALSALPADPGRYGDAVFSAGRLDAMKRFDLLLRALALCRRPVRFRLAGTGPEAERLRALAAELGIAERVDFLGWVPEAELVRHYGEALAVYYAPFDEDYGYVTLEAFQAARAVVTTADAGGVLEWVEEGENGFVTAPKARAIAARLDALFDDRALAHRLGLAGRRRAEAVHWEAALDTLTSSLPPESP